MPREIRDKIWVFLLGDQLIHLEYLATAIIPASDGQVGGSQVWRHSVCEHGSPENLMIQEATWPHLHLRSDAELACEGHKKIDLRALRVCRQMYIEANDVLWSTNTFSFNDAAISLDRFMSTRTARQKRSLRKLQLHLDWEWDDGGRVHNQVLSMRLIRSLAGLRILRLQIIEFMHAATFQQMKASGTSVVHTRHLPFLHKLAALSLTKAEVFVNDSMLYWYTNTKWTVEDRMEYAEEIRKILLNPKERRNMPKSRRSCGSPIDKIEK